MAFRKCPNHGWLKTSEYTVCEWSGETICPECGVALHGYREDRNAPPWFFKKRSRHHEFEPPLEIYGACGPLCSTDKIDDDSIPLELFDKAVQRHEDGLMEDDVYEKIMRAKSA